MNIFKKPAAISVSRRRLLLAVPLICAGSLMPCASFAGAYDDFFKCVKIDDAGTVKSLLLRGLDPNLIEAERNDTGLILALREDSMRVFSVLLNARDIDVEAKSRNGDTALMIAAYKGNKPAVEALLAKKAEVNRPGWTALHYAAAVGRNDIVILLLEKYAYIDAESPNKTTPLMMAALGGHIGTIKLLLDEGADASLKNEPGMSAADIAARFDNYDVAQDMIKLFKQAGKN